MRAIGIVTVGRSDYGIYLPVLRAIQRDTALDLKLIVAGMHLSPEFGMTVEKIQADGFEIYDRVEMLLSSDTPRAISMSMGLGSIGFAGVYDRLRPDILVVLGDRFEMHAAAVAALPFKIPVAHIHGGELTQGAIDDALRHSITKLSHLHFVSTKEYARRVVQLGEEPWRVTVSGAPSLDNLETIALPSGPELAGIIGMSLEPPPLLVTFHPTTLDYEHTDWQVKELLAALDAVAMPVVFTQSNADTAGRQITLLIQRFVESHPSARLICNLGTEVYFGLMTHATAMVGNSSSGIIEAASFHLAVVNIGRRQEGRVQGLNVIDTIHDREAIKHAIEKALSPDFQNVARTATNPYKQKAAAASIVDVLKNVSIDDRLIIKSFYDLPVDPNCMVN